MPKRQTMMRAVAAAGFLAFAAIATGSAVAQDNVIKDRQDHFKASAASMRAIKGVIDKGGPTTEAAAAAKQLVDWYVILPSKFPAGSDKGETKALPEIWSDNATFVQLAKNAEDAALKLADASAKGDVPALNAAFGVMGQQCGACHNKFRAK